VVVGAAIVILAEERAEGELVIMSKKGQVIKLAIKGCASPRSRYAGRAGDEDAGWRFYCLNRLSIKLQIALS
jgi:hypothetical protein